MLDYDSIPAVTANAPQASDLGFHVSVKRDSFRTGFSDADKGSRLVGSHPSPFCKLHERYRVYKGCDIISNVGHLVYVLSNT